MNGRNHYKFGWISQFASSVWKEGTELIAQVPPSLLFFGARLQLVNLQEPFEPEFSLTKTFRFLTKHARQPSFLSDIHEFS